ncbi:MAG TPA: dephospho-CoA kinase [Pyrinomonadaceae bacterium]|nr:dephospho-CoA kinase [Pyrinomonadaceae bacterium]
MLRVGLTGSIGVGKSFVAGVFAELGCHVMDADDVARDVVAPGSEALARIVSEFGATMLQANGALDRQKLGAVVFANSGKRKRLNLLLHPYIIHEQDLRLREWEATDPQGIGIVDAALMIESGGSKRFDKLIVVHCRPEIQLARLMARNNFSREEAEQRIKSQMSQEEKLAFADYAIDTSDGFEDTRKRAEEVYRALVELAEKR